MDTLSLALCMFSYTIAYIFFVQKIYIRAEHFARNEERSCWKVFQKCFLFSKLLL